jgi:Zn-finger nucleic acid-binding protein
MKCPACSNELSHADVNGVEVDVCKGGCGGIWFDNYEFKKFDEPHEHAGEELLGSEIDPNVTVDHSEKRNCPKCENIIMMRHFFSVKKEVELDECAGCAGIWLDTGELARLRSLFTSEDDRKEAAEKVFDDLLGPQLEALATERAKNRQKARRMANMFKFICPSYYISGKQGWGAF